MVDKEPLKKYPIWSNFVYFFAALFAACQSFVPNKKINIFYRILFGIFGLLILGAGVSSIIYHLNTPSWTNNPYIKEEPEYKLTADIDMGFAISAIVYASLFLLLRLYSTYTDNLTLYNYPLFHTQSWWVSVFFIILSVVFYFIAAGHDSATNDCDDANNSNNPKKCFKTNIDAYDVFHSTWHIFAAVTAFFWIDVLKISFNWI